MAWCKNCQTEFEEYVINCSDCGQPLISDEEYRPDKTEVSNEKSVYYAYNKLTQLTNCPNSLMADMLISMLEANDIPGSITHDGIGSYMNILGVNSIYGVNVMVPEKDLEKAKDILKDFSYDEDYDEEEYEGKTLNLLKMKKKLMYAFIIIFCLIELGIFIYSK